jgi:hypothetical protein
MWCVFPEAIGYAFVYGAWCDLFWKRAIVNDDIFFAVGSVFNRGYQISEEAQKTSHYYARAFSHLIYRIKQFKRVDRYGTNVCVCGYVDTKWKVPEMDDLLRILSWRFSRHTICN